MVDLLRRVWARYWLRNAKFSGRYGDLRRLYAMRDPWNLSGSDEQGRFAATNERIRALAPDCGSLLELGCGEGQQTEWLARVSSAVSGLDVSDKAVERARQRCPEGTFRAGPAEALAALFPGRRFDVITACEMLYYAPDAAVVLDAAKAFSDIVLVTNFSERAPRLRHHLVGPGWTGLEDIRVGNLTWECAAWRKATS